MRSSLFTASFAWVALLAVSFGAHAQNTPLPLEGYLDMADVADAHISPDGKRVMYVANVKTLTMLMTGELDLNTPMAQAEDFYRALKLRDGIAGRTTQGTEVTCCRIASRIELSRTGLSKRGASR